MTRRLAAAVLAGALFASTLPTPPANAAGGPWSMASTTPLVAGAFTSSTAGKDVTVALVNKTSLGDSLQLPVAVTFVLNALGFGGSFSVTATWVPGPGPTLDCPPAVLGIPVDMACVGGGSSGAVLVPGLSRALLLAHAPALTGENQLTAVPTMASLSYDLTVMVVGLVLGVACLDGACGLGADGIRTIALRVMPQAAGAVSALIHNDAATALSELRGLATTVAGMLLKASAAFALGVATAGMLEIKLGIALTKAVLPFINLAAVLVAMQLAGAQGAVTISYTAPTPPPTPRPTPRPTPAPTPTPRPNTSFHVSTQVNTCDADGKITMRGEIFAGGGTDTDRLTIDSYAQQDVGGEWVTAQEWPTDSVSFATNGHDHSPWRQNWYICSVRHRILMVLSAWRGSKLLYQRSLSSVSC